MMPTSTATPAAHDPQVTTPAPSAPPEDSKSGAAANTTAPPPVLEADGSFVFVYTIDPLITKRLLTRTGRAKREQMLIELPKYVDRIIRRALENEVF